VIKPRAFADYTAQDTLQGLLRESFIQPHSHLAAVCTTHLARCGFQDTKILSQEEFCAARQNDPLLTYASDAWAVHARESLTVNDTRERIANFVCQAISFPAFTSLDLLDSFDILSPLHILAIYDLPLSLVTHADIGDPNPVTQIYQESPLTLASYHDQEGAAKSLLEHPATRVNLVNNEEWSALMAAVRYGHDRIAILLLARPEIQVNLVDNQWWTALMKAARHGHEGIVRLLLAHPEIQVNSVDREGWSALLLAASPGHWGIAKLLLEHPKIQVNLVHSKGWSALMLAAAFGHEGNVKLLLKRPDIQVNLVDNAGWSALMLAVNGGHQDTVRLLLDVPFIDIAIKSRDDDHTAISIASALGYVEIAQLLHDFEQRHSISVSFKLTEEWLNQRSID
jgi:ankyrin repeat protein